MLTPMISFSGVGVVAAAAVIEAIGHNQTTRGGMTIVLVCLAVVLLIAGVATLAAECRVRPPRPTSDADKA